MKPQQIKDMIYLECEIARYESFLSEIEKYQARPNKPMVMVEKPEYKKTSPGYTVRNRNDGTISHYSKQYDQIDNMHNFVHNTGQPAPMQEVRFKPENKADHISINVFSKSGHNDVTSFNISPEILNAGDVFELAKSSAKSKLEEFKKEFGSYFKVKKIVSRTVTYGPQKKKKKVKIDEWSDGLSKNDYDKAKELLFLLNNVRSLLHSLEKNTRQYFKQDVFIMSDKNEEITDFEEVDFVTKSKLFNQEKSCLQNLIDSYLVQIENI
mgnify:CR=1 FL=1